MKEKNPMLGFRGCRIGIVYPEITAMQTSAILSAAVAARSKGVHVAPEILIPLVSATEELKEICETIHDAAEKLFKSSGHHIAYKVGVMLETPRACIIAEKLVAEGKLQFISFGSNDLTQLTYGFSRDDANKFLSKYVERSVLLNDPFVTLGSTTYAFCTVNNFVNK